MSAQYLVSLNDTELVEVLSSEGAGVAASDADTSSKQRDALYYIVAVISFYALTFLVLLFKYARFKKKEVEETFSYFPLPPDAKMAAAALGARGSRDCETEEVLGAKKCRLFRGYGSGGTTPKTLRVKLSPMWPYRDDTAKACDV